MTLTLKNHHNNSDQVVCSKYFIASFAEESCKACGTVVVIEATVVIWLPVEIK